MEVGWFAARIVWITYMKLQKHYCPDTISRATPQSTVPFLCMKPQQSDTTYNALSSFRADTSRLLTVVRPRFIRNGPWRNSILPRPSHDHPPS